MEFLPVIEGLLREKTCIVGMGNYLRRDDAVGLYLVDGISDRIAPGSVTVMNVEDVLENYLFRIVDGEYDNVIIVDAVRSGNEAGSVLFGRLRDFDEVINNFSTHKLALLLTGKVLAEYDTKAWLVGIEVRDTDFGSGLTDEVRKSADILRDILLNYINCDRKELVYEH
ncbi:MAG: hydrogenase maturation protease [Spirochaetes bacterium]|nr:hydrogenase maturation protease [Spirochaetota bacterium]